MGVAGPTAVAQFVLVAIAFAALTAGYVLSDFSVLNVSENSHSAKPLIYKITGVWGNHEGSMLLWVLILALFGALVAAFGGNLPRLKALVLAVQALDRRAPPGSSSSLTSNPFLRLVAGAVRGPRSQPGAAGHRRSRSIRRCSTSAMSASRSRSPSPSRR